MTQSVSPGASTSCTSALFSEPSECIAPSPSKTVCDEADISQPATTTGWHAQARSNALRFCQEADSVVEGFLCGEPMVISNACRKPENAFDAYVCDEPRMHALQKSIAFQTLSLLKSIWLQLLGRRG